MEEILGYVHYSYQYLIRYFQHQLRIKITVDIKELVSTDFNESWVSVTGLNCLNGH